MGGLRAAGRRPRGGVQEATGDPEEGCRWLSRLRVQQLWVRWQTLAHLDSVTCWGGEDRPGVLTLGASGGLALGLGQASGMGDVCPH